MSKHCQMVVLNQLLMKKMGEIACITTHLNMCGQILYCRQCSYANLHQLRIQSMNVWGRKRKRKKEIGLHWSYFTRLLADNGLDTLVYRLDHTTISASSPTYLCSAHLIYITYSSMKMQEYLWHVQICANCLCLDGQKGSLYQCGLLSFPYGNNL